MVKNHFRVSGNLFATLKCRFAILECQKIQLEVDIYTDHCAKALHRVAVI